MNRVQLLPSGETKPVTLVYGERIRIARHYRGILRHQLAERIGVSTQEIRKYERAIVNRFAQSRWHNEVQANPVPLDVVQKIADVTGFLVGFFVDYADPRAFMPHHFCQNPDVSLCYCGADATLLCDALIPVNVPIWNDVFNRHVLGYGYFKTTCDAPICADHAQHIRGKDYCEGHHVEQRIEKKKRRAKQ